MAMFGHSSFLIVRIAVGCYHAATRTGQVGQSAPTPTGSCFMVSCGVRSDPRPNVLASS
jgi:hypothetical protein